ncbi:MAG: cation:proton antiporter [Methanosarcinales archaeon]|nr:cation:proton antiporter [Methanosarcinales archaeon]
MEVFQILLLDIALALILSKVFGHVFERLKQPSVVGELIAGVILGGSILGQFVPSTILDFSIPEFEYFGHIGILFLLFLAGLEVDIGRIKKTGGTAALATAGGVIAPLILGYLAGIALGYTGRESFVLGVVLTATSIGITVRTLMDLHVLNTDVGAATLSAAVMDDILGLMLLIVAVGTGSLLILGTKVAIFFLVTLVIGWLIISKVMDIGDRIHADKSLVAFSIALCFIWSVIAGETVVAQIVGAFIAGLIMNTTIQSKRVISDVKTIGYAFFIPLFFIGVGTMVKLSVFLDLTVVTLAVVILVMAILGKVGGCGLGAWIGRFNLRESLQLGFGMVPRCEVALIAVAIAIDAGVITGEIADIFLAATFILVTITMLITPILLKALFKRELAKMPSI